MKKSPGTGSTVGSHGMVRDEVASYREQDASEFSISVNAHFLH